MQEVDYPCSEYQSLNPLGIARQNPWGLKALKTVTCFSKQRHLFIHLLYKYYHFPCGHDVKTSRGIVSGNWFYVLICACVSLHLPLIFWFISLFPHSLLSLRRHGLARMFFSQSMSLWQQLLREIR